MARKNELKLKKKYRPTPANIKLAGSNTKFRIYKPEKHKVIKR